jgi:hypothetical protein
MPDEPTRRRLVIGQQTGRGSHLTHLVLGLLGLLYVGTSVLQARPSFALLGQVAGRAILATTLYLVIFWALGERARLPDQSTGTSPVFTVGIAPHY